MVIILIAVIGFIKFYDRPLNNFVFIGAMAFIVSGIFLTETHRKLESYKVTQYYLIHSRGIFSKKIKKIMIDSIVDIDQKQTFWQLLFDFGSVEVHVASGTNIIRIKDINSPGEFIDFL